MGSPHMPDEVRTRLFWLVIIASCSLILGVLAGLATFESARERFFGVSAAVIRAQDTKCLGTAMVKSATANFGLRSDG